MPTCDYITSLSPRHLSSAATDTRQLLSDFFNFFASYAPATYDRISAVSGTLDSGSGSFTDTTGTIVTSITWTLQGCDTDGINAIANMTPDQGVLVGGSILGLWALAWSIRVIARFLISFGDESHEQV